MRPKSHIARAVLLAHIFSGVSTVYGGILSDWKLATLVDESAVIALVKVQDVTTQPHGQRVARAYVLETWKGEPGRQVTYSVDRSNACDSSDAIVGETIVLFLESRPEPQFIRIAINGSGRFQVREHHRRKIVFVGIWCGPELECSGVIDDSGREILTVDLSSLRTMIQNLHTQRARGSR